MVPTERLVNGHGSSRVVCPALQNHLRSILFRSTPKIDCPLGRRVRSIHGEARA
jgi:hypothetical protein